MANAIDAAFEASLLMGQANSPGLDELTRRALKINEEGSRLYVHWRASEAVECKAIGPATRCFCGHSYSSHAWYETGSKKVRCRVDGCKCECFNYVPGRGASFIRCACKHTHEEHRGKDGRPGGCSKCGCACFKSDWRCSCGATFDEHHVAFETASERAQLGLNVEENLGGWGREKPHLDAVCGGVTRMTSLLSGDEKSGIAALPHTDAAAAAAGRVAQRGDASSASALSSTAAAFAKFDRKADGHIARLRKLREATSKAQEEGFRGGAAAATPKPAGRRLGDGAGVPNAGGVRRAPLQPQSSQGAGKAAAAAGKAPSAEMRRNMAAAAAEARAAAEEARAAAGAVGEGAAAQSVAPSPVAGSAGAAGPLRPRPPGARPSGPAAAAGGRPAQGSARRAGASGGGKAAVKAMRRERAADAAESRMLAAQEASSSSQAGSSMAASPVSCPDSPASPGQLHLEAARRAVRGVAAAG